MLPPNANLPELPAQPALPDGATRIASGMVTVAVAPGGSQDLEAQQLISNAPPSAAVVWTIAWRSTDPLTASWYRQGGTTDLGRGRWGSAELGGAGFRLRNDGAATVFAEVHYVIGSR
ncbi:MAG TPA: hypothetical protein VLI88_02320 [Patescibacteria group bacterium]|nr:hypothetical protein [Patescibacteria group bacterium]